MTGLLAAALLVAQATAAPRDALAAAAALVAPPGRVPPAPVPVAEGGWPDDPALSDEARTALEEERWGDAVAALRADGGPTLVEAWTWLVALDNPARAAELLRAEVRRDRDSAEAWRLLGLAEAAQGRHGEALAAWRRAAALDRDDPRCRAWSGHTWLAHRRWRDAEAAYAAALARDPELGEARLGLGIALVETGRAADAIPHLRAAWEAEPGATAAFHLGRAYAAVGDLAAARDVAARLAAIDADAAARLERDLRRAAAGRRIGRLRTGFSDGTLVRHPVTPLGTAAGVVLVPFGEERTPAASLAAELAGRAPVVLRAEFRVLPTWKLGDAVPASHWDERIAATGTWLWQGVLAVGPRASLGPFEAAADVGPAVGRYSGTTWVSDGSYEYATVAWGIEAEARLGLELSPRDALRLRAGWRATGGPRDGGLPLGAEEWGPVLGLDYARRW